MLIDWGTSPSRPLHKGRSEERRGKRYEMADTTSLTTGQNETDTIWGNQTDVSSHLSGEVGGEVGPDRIEGGPFIKLLRENYYGFIGYSIALIAGTLALVVLLKIYLKRKCGINWCVGENHNANSAQLRSDAAAAARLQRELEEELRQEAIERKRKRRREQAEAALEEYTLVVEDGENLILVDHEFMNAGEHSYTDDARELVLKLPTASAMSNDYSSEKRRYRDANCSVCMMCYEDGDAVIWSPNLECVHCYHSDCILTWLSRGKKKCPCCRMDFIPKSSENEESAFTSTTQQRPENADVEPSILTSPESTANDHALAGSVTPSGDQETTDTLGDDETNTQVVIVVGSGEVEEEDDDDDELVLAQIIEQRAVNISADSLANSHRSASTGGGRASVLSESIRSITSARSPTSLGGSHRSATSSSRGSPRHRLR